jgi:hypothetical protein
MHANVISRSLILITKEGLSLCKLKYECSKHPIFGTNITPPIREFIALIHKFHKLVHF